MAWLHCDRCLARQSGRGHETDSALFVFGIEGRTLTTGVVLAAERENARHETVRLMLLSNLFENVRLTSPT